MLTERFGVEVIFAHIKPAEHVEAAGEELFKRQRLRRERYAAAVRNRVYTGGIRAGTGEKGRKIFRVELLRIVSVRIDDLYTVVHGCRSFELKYDAA